MTYSFYRLVDNLGLKKSRDCEYDGEEGDGADIFDDPLCQGIGLMHSLTVIQRIMDGNEPLASDCHGHENRGRDCDLVKGIQQVREQHDVQIRPQLELLPETLQDAAKQL